MRILLLKNCAGAYQVFEKKFLTNILGFDIILLLIRKFVPKIFEKFFENLKICFENRSRKIKKKLYRRVFS